MKKHISIAYIDLLTCLFALFLAFFVLMNDEQAQGTVDDPSLFLASIEWPKESRNDVDLFVKDPYGTVLNFTKRETEIMTLDTDDVGSRAVDVVRREVASVKKLVPGRYVVNALFFKNNDGKPVNVKAQVLKLQGFAIVCEAEFVLVDDGQEKTVCSFVVDDAGKVVSVDKTSQESLVRS